MKIKSLQDMWVGLYQAGCVGWVGLGQVRSGQAG